jgi:hypothetical protein
VTWDECLDDGLSHPSKIAMFDGDPQGQGRELLGLGFKRHPDWPKDKQLFSRIDRFVVNKVADRSGAPITGITVDNLTLVGQVVRDGSSEPVTDWDGATFEGKLRCVNPKFRTPHKSFISKEIAVKVRIAATRHMPMNLSFGGPKTQGQSSTVYALEYESGDHSWKQACEDPGDIAFPIPGYWETNGTYLANPPRKTAEFSFACVKRDVARCLRRGYLANAESHSDQKILFEACTRMMRADYCGDGTTYTEDGSAVTSWDNRKIVAKDQHQSPLVFEAAWNAGGMFCISRTRYPNLVPSAPDASRACLERMTKKCDEQSAEAIDRWPLLYNSSCGTHPCACEGIGCP